MKGLNIDFETVWKHYLIMSCSARNRGFIGVVMLFFVATLVTIGAVYAASQLRVSSINQPLLVLTSSSSPLLTPATPSPTPADLIYTDTDLGFSFTYPPQGYSVVTDNEDKYNALSGANQRRNFYQTWWYEPPTLVKGLYVRTDSAENLNQFSLLPFTLWVFDNPDNLTPNQWYDKYWYYPFLWGDYEPRKLQDGPDQTATISGYPAAYKIVAFQAGNPQFIYIPKDDKMFLIRLFDNGSTDSLSSKILASFTFK